MKRPMPPTVQQWLRQHRDARDTSIGIQITLQEVIDAALRNGREQDQAREVRARVKALLALKAKSR